MFQGGLFKGFKGSLCQLVKHQGKVPRGDASPALGSVSMETVQETSEILILLTLMVELPSLSAMADL